MKKYFMLITLIAFAASASIAECETKISVFPLKPVGGKEAEDISKAVHEILLSQLLEKNSVTPVSNQSIPSDDKEAAAKALKEGSDYALTGGLAMLGKTSSISIRLIDAKTATPVHAENKTAAKQDEIPEILSLITQKIKSTASAAKKTTDTASVKTVPLVQAPEIEAPKKDAPLLKEESDTLIDPINKNLIFKTDPVDERIISLAKLKNEKGKEDIIIGLTRNQVLLFKKTQKGLSLSSRPEAAAGYRNLRVDTADIKGDGHDQIFMTRINTSFNSPVTNLYNLDKEKLNLIESKSGFFSASAYINCKKEILVQREDRGTRLYSGDIYLVQSKGLEGAAPFKAPSGISLDSFVQGKITEKKENIWLVYNNENKMALINEKGEDEWNGDEGFGGSMESMEKQMEAGRNQDTARYYFKQRLIGFCDSTGKTYVLTVKNEDIAKGLLAGFKKFTSGKAVVYGWSGIGLKEIWSSESIPGGIHDIELFDADGDGKKDLIFAASMESTFKSKGYLGGLRLPEKISDLLK